MHFPNAVKSSYTHCKYIILQLCKVEEGLYSQILTSILEIFTSVRLNMEEIGKFIIY